MDFALTEEQQQLKDWAHEFAVNEIRPVAAKYDASQEFPWPVVKAAAKTGMYGMELYLNHQADPSGLTMPLIMEEVFWGCAGIGLSIFGTGLPLATVAGSGTPDQLFEWAPRMFGEAEDPSVAGFAATEPDAGSDVRSLKTRAVRDGDSWVLDGQKVYCTNGGVADVWVVVATVDPDLGHRGQASFILCSDDDGVRPGKKEDKLGIRASDTSELLLDDCRVPLDRVLGGVDKLDAKLAKARGGTSTGSSSALRTFETTRPFVAVQAIGIARAAMEFAVDYAQQREAFGEPIINHQGVAFKLADMATDVETARLLTHKAAWLAATGQEFPLAEGSMSKLRAGEVAVSVTEKAVQVLGGAGYITDFPVEKWYRDAKIYTIFEGTSEIQRRVIGRALARLNL